MKKQFILVSVIVAVNTFFMNTAQSGSIPPVNVACWFFRGDTLGTQNGCIYESTSWAGGGISMLQSWNKKFKASIAWGSQGRGDKPCEDVSLNGVCGSQYFRNPKTLKRITYQEGKRLQMENQLVIECVQAKINSVCWLRHSSLD